MITRNTFVATACGLILLIGAFALGWKLALATQDKIADGQAGMPSPSAHFLSQPVGGEPSVAASSSEQALLRSLVARVRDHKLQTLRLEEQLTTLTDQVASLTETVSRLEREAAKDPRPPSRQTDEASFIAAGFDPATAADLAKRLNQLALEEIYLRDQAIREGWIGTQQYQEARAELQHQTEAFQAELDEDAYDRFLYATGRPNRITVESVISESPAEWVGLQSGDRILRYAGEPMYRWSTTEKS